MAKFLNTPYRTRYKFYHFRLAKKGIKGIYNVKKEVIAIRVKNKTANVMTPGQIEVIRRMFSKKIKKNSGYINIRCFPDLPLTKKPLGSRMGKGKGKFSSWKAPIKNGQNLLEVTFVRGKLEKKDDFGYGEENVYKKLDKEKTLYTIVKEINKKVVYRLPIDTKVVCRKTDKQNYEKKWNISNKIILKDDEEDEDDDYDEYDQEEDFDDEEEDKNKCNK